jgi:hypothetical protein
MHITSKKYGLNLTAYLAHRRGGAEVVVTELLTRNCVEKWIRLCCMNFEQVLRWILDSHYKEVHPHP